MSNFETYKGIKRVVSATGRAGIILNNNFTYLADNVEGVEGNTVKNNFTASTAPTVNDDSGDDYEVGSIWIDNSTSPATVYKCLDDTAGAAVWRQLAYFVNLDVAFSNLDANAVVASGPIFGITTDDILLFLPEGGSPTGSSHDWEYIGSEELVLDGGDF